MSRPIDAVIALGASAAILGLFMRGFDRKRAFWVAAGLLYCGLPMVALLWLRGIPHGLGIDGGPFLPSSGQPTSPRSSSVARSAGASCAPSISPNKTWAGAIGGVAAARVGGLPPRCSSSEQRLPTMFAPPADAGADAIRAG